MQMVRYTRFTIIILVIFIVLVTGCTSEQKSEPPESIPGPSIIDLEDIAASSSGIVLTDAIGRQVTVPRNISHVLCSGPGCMRYLAYLQATGMATGADQAERNTRLSPAPAYLKAHPEIHFLPATGKTTGSEDPETITALSPRPDIIFRMGESPQLSADELQQRTSIPVLVLNEGDLSFGRTTMNYALRVMGVVLGKSERAEEVIRFFDKVTDNLQTRTWTVPDFQQQSAYLGAYSDPEPGDLYSTTSVYIPFRLVSVKNTAEEYASQNGLAGKFTLPKEALSRMGIDALFIDMTTWSRTNNAVTDLEKSDILERVVKEGEVYALLPDALYGQEHEADLINAYLIGKTLYPEKFTDVDPKVMADYIYAFLYDEPLFEEINRDLGGIALSRIPLFT
jgi:iron complex transport system substrate-binding protein